MIRRLWVLRLLFIGCALLLVACEMPESPPRPTQPPLATPVTPPAPTAEPTEPTPSGAVLAFPGAEGYGTATQGGRGGRIIYVTNLNDSGTGSLRAALEASGPRMVLFKVAGTIELEDDIDITNPYITIAGQSAPGEGVQIKGGMLKIQTHDVIIRYLRMRPGDGLNESNTDDRDALTLAGNNAEVYNVVIDHCSIIWGPDIGGLAILTDVHDVTISYSIIGEGLYQSNHYEAKASNGGHSMGLNITQLNTSAYPRRITIHHNLLTSSDRRMPQIMGGEHIDVINNVIYNWGSSAAHGNPRSLNLMNNMFIKGPMTSTAFIWKARTNSENPKLRPESIYEAGNETEGFTGKLHRRKMLYASQAFPLSLTHIESAEEAYNRIVEDVGASRPVLDSVDQRILNNLKNRTGSFLSASDIAWPVLKSEATPADDDEDGMPDSWEQEHFGTTARGSTTDSSADFDKDGYTDVEEYLNDTDPSSPTR